MKQNAHKGTVKQSRDEGWRWRIHGLSKGMDDSGIVFDSHEKQGGAMLAVLTFIVFLLSSMVCMAADLPTSEKRIYLIDVTASMEGRGRTPTANIFSTVKENLIKSIEHISDPKTEIVIIPFTSRPRTPITAYSSKRDSLVSLCRGLTVLPGDTNIADAWLEGVRQLDSTKINYMFLLTDGLHNSGPTKEEMFHRLREWESISDHGYMYAFYVMLTPEAKELEICRIVDETANLWLIESMEIDAALMRPVRYLPVHKNIFENSSISFPLQCNNSFADLDELEISLTLEDDPYYTVAGVNGNGLSFSFDLAEIVPRSEIPVRDSLRISISHDREKYPFVFFTPDHYEFVISNMGTRAASVNAGGLSIWDDGKTISFEKVRFKEPFRGPFALCRRILEPTLKFPPFRWFAPDTVFSFNTFSYSFNEEATRSGSTIHLELSDTVDVRQSALVSNIDTLIVADAPTFEHVVKLGVRPGTHKSNFSGLIYAEATDLDMLNDNTIEEGRAVLYGWRMKYRRPWPVILWTLWLLCAYIIVYLLSKGIYYMFVLLSRLFKVYTRRPSQSGTRGNVYEKVDKKQEKHGVRCYLIIKYICWRYMRSRTIHQRSQWLYRLMVALEKTRKHDPVASDDAFRQLPPPVQSDLEKLWEVTNTKSDGPCNDVVSKQIRGLARFTYPTNNGLVSAGVNKVLGQYNDFFKSMHRRPIKNEVKYRYGRIDLSSMAIAKVRIRYEDTNCGRYAKAGAEGVQTLACKKLARNRRFMRRIAALGYDVKNCTGAEAVNNFRCAYADNRRDVPFKREGTPLVWHEDPDCMTVYLVPDLIHDKLNHYGGIRMAKIIQESSVF